MKVFATIKRNYTVELLAWPSVECFERAEDWLNHEFIDVCTTCDMKEDGLFSATLDHNDYAIPHTADQIASHSLMHKKYLEIAGEFEF